MAAAVLDSYALLAFFRGEDTAVQVKQLLHHAASTDQPLHMTEVNYAEVKYTLIKKDGPAAWAQTGGSPTWRLILKPAIKSAWPMRLAPRSPRSEKPVFSPATPNSNRWKRKSRSTGSPNKRRGRQRKYPGSLTTGWHQWLTADAPLGKGVVPARLSAGCGKLSAVCGARNLPGVKSVAHYPRARTD